MLYYVQFTENRSNKTYDCLGSDGVFILDGRNSINTMIDDAYIQKDRLRKVKNIDGFKIVKGSRFSDNNFIVWQTGQIIKQ